MVFGRKRRRVEADAMTGPVDEVTDAVIDFADSITPTPPDDAPDWGTQAEPTGGFPQPTDAPDADEFLFVVQDVFSITGRGTVATGQVERGTIRVGDAVVIHGAGGVRPCRVTGIESLRRRTDTASAGDDVGLMLAGVRRGDLDRGDRITAH